METLSIVIDTVYIYAVYTGTQFLMEFLPSQLKLSKIASVDLNLTPFANVILSRLSVPLTVASGVSYDCPPSFNPAVSSACAMTSLLPVAVFGPLDPNENVKVTLGRVPVEERRQALRFMNNARTSLLPS